jgi:hypothetical protein
MSLGSGNRDPGSGINLFRIPDPVDKKAPNPRSRIRIRNTGLMSFWEFKKAVFTILKHKYRGLAIGGLPSVVYAVIDLYGVCGQVGAERESLMSFWEFKKAVFTIL